MQKLEGWKFLNQVRRIMVPDRRKNRFTRRWKKEYLYGTGTGVFGDREWVSKAAHISHIRGNGG